MCRARCTSWRESTQRCPQHGDNSGWRTASEGPAEERALATYPSTKQLRNLALCVPIYPVRESSVHAMSLIRSQNFLRLVLGPLHPLLESAAVCSTRIVRVYHRARRLVTGSTGSFYQQSISSREYPVFWLADLWRFHVFSINPRVKSWRGENEYEYIMTYDVLLLYIRVRRTCVQERSASIIQISAVNVCETKH